jgi:protease I
VLHSCLSVTRIATFEPWNSAGSFFFIANFSQANSEEFDAVLHPGGALNADNLRVEKKAQEVVRKMDQAGKPIAVI